MTYSIYHPERKTELTIEETLCQNTCIIIDDIDDADNCLSHYLNPKELDDFISALHLVQKKLKAKYNLT